MSSNNDSFELPAGERKNGSFLRPGSPTGTTFNKKAVILVTMAIGLIIMFSLIAAFSVSKTTGKKPGRRR